ncbi:MAG: hypothetical protein WCO19_00700 [Candidatus Saccharibacteria bacterium]|nr:hypothetical protein [Candidatus Saccharibacteria bacterium]
MLGSEKLKNLMETPMSRKEFLRYMGIMLLSVIGVGNAISALSDSHKKALGPSSPLKRNGFGGGKYGS